MADSVPGVRSLKGVAAIRTGRRDIDDAEIRLTPPFPMEVSMKWTDRDLDDRHLPSIFAMPLDLPADQGGYSKLGPGRFQILGVHPGRFRMAGYGNAPGAYLESVKLGVTDVTGEPIEVGPSSPPIQLIFGTDGAQVRGKVAGGRAVAVVLLPADESLLDSSIPEVVDCASDGSFEVQGLRPGDYYAFAFDWFDREALADPIFVRTLAAQATKVKAERGAKLAVDLRVTAWPE